MRAPPYLSPSGVVLAGFLCMSFALGCGGSQRSFDGSVYRNGQVAFRIPPPPSGWRRVEVNDASLAFRDDARDAVILVNGRCGGKDDDTPLAALTAHLIMGTTEREYLKEETLPFNGREARHTLLRAKLDGVPRVYDIYVAKKDGCVYDFVHVAPPRSSAPTVSSAPGISISGPPTVSVAQAVSNAQAASNAPDASSGAQGAPDLSSAEVGAPDFERFVSGFQTIGSGAL
ncbi:hypothetical protein [Pendulispora albinea]|uniref:Lipoprotein n=1 Tax=Pendulispora albinea TaxID=2741071 RepID=A0ABZ2LY68_9BACT